MENRSQSDSIRSRYAPLLKPSILTLHLSNSKRLLSILLFAGQTGFGQTATKSKNASETFIYYAFDGLGSNRGSMQPKVTITGTKLVYTYAQNSYFGKRDKEEQPICTATLKQRSIDSILSFVGNLKNSSIFKVNPCIMSGGIHFLTVSNGVDTTKFELANTFDYTALKVINVINKYLPNKKQLWPDESLITEEVECWNLLFEEGKKSKDSVETKPKM